MRQLRKLARPAARAPRGRRGLTPRLVAFATAGVAAAFAAAALAGPAAATQPTKTQFSASVPATLSGVCSFDVTVTSSVTGFEIDYFNQSGAPTRSDVHVVEQDVFTANGKSLTGLPFTFDIQVLFDSSGNITHVFANGLVEKVPLPDGSLFITAGRLDFAAHGFPSFLITPDVGATVNLAGFCAALS